MAGKQSGALLCGIKVARDSILAQLPRIPGYVVITGAGIL